MRAMKAIKRYLICLLILNLFSTTNHALGFIFHPLRSMLRAGKSFDHRKCLTAPKTYYGHFFDSLIQPDEIHNFFINELEPNNRHGIGQNLIQTEQRIITVDSNRYATIGYWKVHKVEACIPNSRELQASY